MPRIQHSSNELGPFPLEDSMSAREKGVALLDSQAVLGYFFTQPIMKSLHYAQGEFHHGNEKC